MISKPALASRTTANASGPSKPLNSGAERLKSEGLSKTAAMPDYRSAWLSDGLITLVGS
jgi:hypothetical protein